MKLKPSNKKLLGLLFFLFILAYYIVINVIFFAPLPYSVTEGAFSLTSEEYQTIFEKWTRLVTIEIEFDSDGPLILIHTVISDDFAQEIPTQGKYQFRFQTWQISLSTRGANTTLAEGTYKIIDHTSPLLPKAENNYTSVFEIYLNFMFTATILLLGFFFVVFLLIGLFTWFKRER